MIVLHATIHIKPGKREEALPAFLEMEQASQSEEGCIEYEFVSLLSNPETFRAMERWQDQAALDFHNASAHMATFRQKIADLVSGPSVTKRYEATPLD